jgi:pyruvate,orthophosphate dikinase
VRVWLDIISRNPKWCSTLLSALIINLRLGGTCIKDTDLFQKEITKLLNSDTEPVYNLVKQLTKALPVYFNEIGAEGQLRDVTTDIDELRNRKDILIHFLRKQSHVESSNLIEDFIREIFRFWRLKDKGSLRQFLPPEVFQALKTEGPFIDEVHAALEEIFDRKGLQKEEDLLGLSDPEIEEILSSLPRLSEGEKKRVDLLIEIYRLINQKYHLGFQEIRYHLQQASRWGFEGLDELQKVLDPERHPGVPGSDPDLPGGIEGGHHLGRTVRSAGRHLPQAAHRRGHSLHVRPVPGEKVRRPGVDLPSGKSGQHLL